MSHEVQAVVALEQGKPVSLETMLVPSPGPGEALVRVQACGVCHTDLHYREGGITDQFPFLLGHEAAGQCTEVPRTRPEVAGLLGCGVMAGLGAVLHTGQVGPGDSVAVFGCGGVGAAAIAGAILAGATVVVAVDVDDRKLEQARAFGATHTVNSRREDPVAAVRAATGSFGADVAVEAVGRPEVLEQAFFARDLAGTVVQVGVPTPDMRFPDLPMIEFFGRGGALKPSWYGDCLPSRDFPMVVELYRQGRLDLDSFVSETIGIGDVEAAFGRMARGEVLRSVVVI